MTPSDDATSTATPGYEPSTLGLQLPRLAAVMVVVTVGGALLVAAWMTEWAAAPVAAQPGPLSERASANHRPFSAPSVVPNQSLTRQGLERQQRTALASYAPVDREAGVVAVPIARAMELMTALDFAGLQPLHWAADEQSLTVPASGQETP